MTEVPAEPGVNAEREASADAAEDSDFDAVVAAAVAGGRRFEPLEPEADADPPEVSDGGAATLDEPVVPAEAWCIVAVADVVMDLPNAHPEIVLHEAQHPWRELRIPVGLPDGNAIAHALRGVDTPRPLTHTLMAEVLERHGVSIEAVRITVRRGQSFFAEIDTAGPNGHHVIPCRPSDALALALRRRLPTPILVAEWVFDSDG